MVNKNLKINLSVTWTYRYTIIIQYDECYKHAKKSCETMFKVIFQNGLKIQMVVLLTIKKKKNKCL